MTDADDLGKLELWLLTTCQGLGLQVTTPEEDFFEAGGTSLKAVRLINRIEEEFGEDALPPEDLYAQSSIHEIALRVQRSGQSVTPDSLPQQSHGTC